MKPDSCRAACLTPACPRIILLILFACAPAMLVAQQFTQAQKLKYDSLRVQLPGIKLAWDFQRNTPAAITRFRSVNLNGDTQQIKNYFLRQFALFYAITSAADVRATSGYKPAGRGFKKLVMSQHYRGLPVYGGQLNLNFNNNDQLISVTGKWQPVRSDNTTPRITQAQALQNLRGHIETKYLQGRRMPDTLQLRPEKMVLLWFDPTIYRSQANDSRGPVLSWHIEIKTEVFFVDATNGQVLASFSRVNDARNRETYSQSPDCSGVPGTLTLNEAGAVGGLTPDAETQQAHDFAGTVYDYYFNTHARDSYDGSGATIKSTVHGIPPVDLLTIICCAIAGSGSQCCCNQINAVWHPTLNQMIYGDGGTDGTRSFRAFTSGLDVVAHELTHAVTQYSVLDAMGDPRGLDYNGESGAANEAFSDIFGVMVDRADWLMGEDLVITGYPAGAMRNLADPTNGGSYNTADPINSVQAGHQPHHYNNRYTGTEDAGGVHINSGIINHMAFLLSEGGTHTTSNITVIGIGRAAVEKIMYRTLTGHLTPTSNFLELRRATLSACEEVFPGDAAKYASVWNAFLAVGICDAAAGECVAYEPIDSRDPVHIALALDYSGSMTELAETGGRPKIEVLKDAVEIFLRTWQVFAIPGDEVGLVNFTSDVSPTTLSGQPLLTNINSIVTGMRALPANGYTAMGGALRVALEGVTGRTHPAVILFTNGMQNVNPMALRSGSGATGPYQIINGTPSQAYGGNSGIAANPGVNLSSYATPVHCIAIGRANGDAYHSLLNDIRSETGGLIHITNRPDVALREFYLNDLVHALSLNTIEMIDYRHVHLNQGGILRESFELTKGINRAAFMINWVGTAPGVIRNFTVQAPDGTLLPPTRWIHGTYYSIAVFDFPYIQKNNIAVNPIGAWRVTSGDNVSGAFDCQVALLVDEKDVHYKFNAQHATVWAGEPIRLSALVTGEQQEPLKNLSEVSVTIQRPNNPLGDVLSKTSGSGSGAITDDLPNAATIKLKNILLNPAVQLQLKADTNKLALPDDGSSGDVAAGDGSHEYVFTDTRKPGLYQFTFRVKGNSPPYGIIERNKTISVLMRSRPSVTHSVLVKTITKAGSNNSILVSFVPVDANGYYLGPGYADAIRVEADGVAVTNIVDKLDGSYEAVIVTPKSPQDVPVTINVTGIELYNGPAANIGAGSKWGISLHAGITIPGSPINSTHKPGIAIEADLEYRLRPLFSLELIAGYYAFTGKPSFSGTHIGGLTLYGKKVFPLGGINGYIAAGPGIYKPESVSAAFGVSAGAGLQFNLGTNWVAEAGFSWFVLTGTAKPDFGLARLGIRYRF